ncbi:MAG: hypothetical protein QM564_00605 [Bergeyella sp.]
MMKKFNNLFLLVAVLVLLFSCKKHAEEMSDLDKLRNNNNKKSSYPVTKMDSTQAIQFITKQKIQELLDLSTLYSGGERDTEIDSIIYQQMSSYFSEPDSAKLKPILRELDSLKVKSAKVGNLNVEKKIIGKDTLDIANFEVEFFDKNNNSIGVFNKAAQYVLKITPIQFKKEFRFYFLNFDYKSPKDSTASGVTR